MNQTAQKIATGTGFGMLGVGFVAGWFVIIIACLEHNWIAFALAVCVALVAFGATILNALERSLKASNDESQEEKA